MCYFDFFQPLRRIGMRLTHGFVPTTFGTVAPHRAAFDAPVRVNHTRGHHTHTPRTHWGYRTPPGRTHVGPTTPTGMHHHQRGQHLHSHTGGIATTYAACGSTLSHRFPHTCGAHHPHLRLVHPILGVLTHIIDLSPYSFMYVFVYVTSSDYGRDYRELDSVEFQLSTFHL